MSLITIPAGIFQMGDAAAGTLPHTVDVSEFAIEDAPVTWALWQEVRAWMAARGIAITAGLGKADTHPVHSVRWLDAVTWCNARSAIDGLDLCYGLSEPRNVKCNFNADGWRLPTEAEWEKAARGGKPGLLFPTGNKLSRKDANYLGQTYYPYDLGPNGYNPKYAVGPYPYTSPVGSFPPNGFGVFDMAGNVSEFCWDYYATGYYKLSPAKDPTGPLTGTTRVARGGSWASYAGACRVAARGQTSSIGSFRCARRLQTVSVEEEQAGA